MDIEKIRQLRNADPYQPFRLVMSDGRKLPVKKPYHLAISPIKTSLVHASARGGFEFISIKNVIDAVIEGKKKTSRRRPK